MTANDDTRGRSDNFGAGFEPTPEDYAAALNADAQTVLEYLEECGKVTFEQLRGRTLLPKTYLQTILRDLKEDRYINVSAGYSTVQIKRRKADTDGRDAIPDGGVDLSETRVDMAARDIYRAACNRRRRQTIRILALLRTNDDVEIGCYVPVDTLACAIVAARDQVEPEDVDPDTRRSVYVTLVQTHLPLLDKLGLVRYHDRPQKVEATNDLLELSDLLTSVDRLATRTEGCADSDLFRDADTSEWPGGQ
jgi:hypothetical protein